MKKVQFAGMGCLAHLRCSEKTTTQLPSRRGRGSPSAIRTGSPSLAHSAFANSLPSCLCRQVNSELVEFRIEPACARHCRNGSQSQQRGRVTSIVIPWLELIYRNCTIVLLSRHVRHTSNRAGGQHEQDLRLRENYYGALVRECG